MIREAGARSIRSMTKMMMKIGAMMKMMMKMMIGAMMKMMMKIG
jgi:hypothetical protein